MLLAASTVVCQVAAIEWASLAGAREDKVVGDAVAEALEHKAVIPSYLCRELYDRIQRTFLNFQLRARKVLLNDRDSNFQYSRFVPKRKCLVLTWRLDQLQSFVWV